MPILDFQIIKKEPCSFARAGKLLTPHGVLETPAFLFCATKGTIKGLSISEIKAQHTPILLGNTYHLMIQPGADLIAQLGGLHKFMGWDGPLFTDSGGYQIFSLGYGSVSSEIKGNRKLSPKQKSLLKISEEGAFFASYKDGKRLFLTPESSIDIQQKLGADLICVLDECTPFHAQASYTENSMRMSHRWALRSLQAFQLSDKGTQGLYGISQGGIYPKLRKESAQFISSHPFFGHAIGGSLGASKPQMYEVIDMALEHLSKERPIHLLGIGGIRDIFKGVEKGIDTFDCVSPTRIGRHGCALIKANYWDNAQESFHSREFINLFKSCFKEDPRPIDETCKCTTCALYSRAYLHHLLKAKELLAMSALTLHNVYYMNRLMRAIRNSIHQNSFAHLISEWICP